MQRAPPLLAGHVPKLEPSPSSFRGCLPQLRALRRNDLFEDGVQSARCGGLTANRIPEKAAIGDGKAALSLEEYQQSSGF